MSSSQELHDHLDANLPAGIEDIRQHICLLTTFLAGRRDGDPSSSPNDSLLELWRLFSFLLATGSPNDEVATRVLAVTGKTESNQIHTVVFTCTPLAHEISKQPRRDFDVESYLVSLVQTRDKDDMARFMGQDSWVGEE
jgi:hypothetical protein